MTISGHGTLLGTGMDSASALGVENGSVVSIIVLGTITASPPIYAPHSAVANMSSFGRQLRCIYHELSERSQKVGSGCIQSIAHWLVGTFEESEAGCLSRSQSVVP